MKTIRIICIENAENNENFTINNQYEIHNGIITCDKGKLELERGLTTSDGTFEYASCRFKII